MPAPAPEVVRLVRAFGVVRVVIGVGLLAAPGWTLRLLHAVPRGAGRAAPEPDAVMALRFAAGRDLALGVGALRAPPTHPALRAWARAGALSDAGDVLAFAGNHDLWWPVRALAAAVSGVAAGIGVATARRLAPRAGGRRGTGPGTAPSRTRGPTRRHR